MKKQLQGIALILFGILLNTTSVPFATILPDEYALIPCLFGFGVGLIGVFAVFNNSSSDEN